MGCSMILVNLTAPIEQIGPVNGAGNTLAAGMRALGPALSGQLWGAVSGHRHETQPVLRLRRCCMRLHCHPLPLRLHASRVKIDRSS